MNPLSSATLGMRRAMTRMDGHAQQLARMATDAPVEPATDLVGLIEAGAAFQANLQTVRRTDEALGSLLDAWA